MATVTTVAVGTASTVADIMVAATTDPVPTHTTGVEDLVMAVAMRTATMAADTVKLIGLIRWKHGWRQRLPAVLLCDAPNLRKCAGFDEPAILKISGREPSITHLEPAPESPDWHCPPENRPDKADQLY